MFDVNLIVLIVLFNPKHFKHMLSNVESFDWFAKNPEIVDRIFDFWAVFGSPWPTVRRCVRDVHVFMTGPRPWSRHQERCVRDARRDATDFEFILARCHKCRFFAWRYWVRVVAYAKLQTEMINCTSVYLFLWKFQPKRTHISWVVNENRNEENKTNAGLEIEVLQ